MNPADVTNLEFRDIPSEVNRVADRLRDGNQANGAADVIVLTVHEASADTSIESATGDAVFGAIVDTVDAILDAIPDANHNTIVSVYTHHAYEW